MRYTGVFLTILVFSLEAYSQESLVSEQSMMERRTEIAKMPIDEEKKIAEQFARKNNLPVRMKYRDGIITRINRDGNGVDLLSSTSDSDDSYGFSSGTSMSAPNISKSLALLQQHYRRLNDEFMFASHLKALVLHTADDGKKKGPDYQFGWGVDEHRVDGEDHFPVRPEPFLSGHAF